MKDTIELVGISKPKINKNITNQQILLGVPISPIDRMKIISPDAFEEMVEEWLYEYVKPKYQKIERLAGAGDKGRDVIAYKKYSKNNDAIWDNYQCKHYNESLKPGDMWIEFGKVCYYTYINDYTVPAKYYFVSPKGAGTKFLDLIMNPKKLKSELINKWDTHCKDKITNISIILNSSLLNYINNFDFSIFEVISPTELIEQYKETSYFPFRFGGGLHKRPQEIKVAPEEIVDTEQLYIQKLLDAYSENISKDINSTEELKEYKKLFQHFQRQRTSFYQAESLKVFEKDTLPEGIQAFEELKEEVYLGIVDTVFSDFEDGFLRVKAVTDRAITLVLKPENILTNFVGTKEKSGICHHLANDEFLDKEEIAWVIKDE